MQLRVSILIPVFNQEPRLLKECIDSALSQTFRELEVVVSDNHSNNGVSESLKKYSDERLRVLSPPSFVSMNENFAFCAKQAQGQYISFLSSDDLLLPHAIQSLVDALSKNPNAIFAFGNIYSSRRLPSKKNRYLIRPYGHSSNFYTSTDAEKFFFPWTMASTWMAGDLMYRWAYEATGGFSKCEMLVAGDVWLTKKLLSIGGFTCLDEPLALFRARAINCKEVDRDRRLFDLVDTLSQPQYKEGGFLLHLKHIFHQQIALIHRLGANPGPSSVAIQEARNVFEKLKRRDLVKIIELDLNHHIFVRIVYILLSPVYLFRRLFQNLHLHIKNL